MLQGDDVTMIALGVSGDTPPNAIQSKLADGIHLRWIFQRDLGFPWFGFYLFRREIGREQLPTCMSQYTAALQKGVLGGTAFDSPLGRVSSDRNLVLTEDFPAPGHVEFDLDNRRYLRFDLKEKARAVTAQIGVPGQPVRGGGYTIEFRESHPVPQPNPLLIDPVRFEGFDAANALFPQMRTVSGTGAKSAGLIFGLKLVIHLPIPAYAVSVILTRLSAAACTVNAFGADGLQVGTKALTSGQGVQETVDFPDLGPIARLEVLGGASEQVLLNLLSFAIPYQPPVQIKLTAFSGNAAIGESSVQVGVGQVIPVTFELDGITRIDIAPARAALVDLCAVSVSQAVTTGWTELPRSPNPIGLPVAHPSYPLSVADAAAANALALSRVRYGPAARWQGAPLQELQAQLAEMVKGGPAGTPMGAQQSTAADSLGVPDAPAMPALRPLDFVLLGALHPALAQIVGLSWIDDSAAPQRSYDYMIVADYTGAGYKDPQRILSLIAANDFRQIEAFVVFNKRREPAAPLAPPQGLAGFALPGITMTDAAGTLIDATSNVGLNWNAGRSATSHLLPGKPILYHLWRAPLGNGPSPQPATKFLWLTGPANPADPTDSDNPVLVTGPRLPGGSRPTRSPGWPAPETPLYFVDRGLADGWYGYKLAGVDVFGRHSADSALLPVRVLDRTPPPAPSAVEAWVLDAADPLLVKDAAYKAWRAQPSLANVVGLRVRWAWTIAHMRQAPDTKEFRIYLSPGSEPPPNARAAPSWPTRYYVVPYSALSIDGFTPATDKNGTAYQGTVTSVTGNRLALQSTAALRDLTLLGAHIAIGSARLPILARDNTTVTVPSAAGIAAGASWKIGYPVRVYDVLLPLASDPPADVPLTPTIQNPLLYAHVGVSAADDKATPDAAKWSGSKWGGRAGNEGAVSAPAKVYRVLRTPPPRPEPIGGDARVYATRANVDGESFYTYRWRKPGFLKTHIFRALFDAVVQTDWRIRTTRRALDPTAVSHAELFPPDWSLARKQAAAQQIVGIAAKAGYAALSIDARTVLAALPGNAGSAKPVADRDWAIRTSRWQLSSNDPFFPASWAADANRRQQVAAKLNALQKLADYETLSDHALRILAGLPGNELAFSQITVQPLGDERVDARGPDDPPGYVPDANVLAWLDTLPGLTSGRYFYRSAVVTSAHNLSPLGLAGPPVYVPNVRPPLMPVLDSVAGGDRVVSLSWRASGEPDLKERRIYRAATETAAADVRDMQRVATLPPGDTQWKDQSVPVAQTQFYRLTAVNLDGLESTATPPAAARAYDDSHPDPPTWGPVQADTAKLHVVLKWTAAVPDLRCLIQRRAPGESAWTAVTAWLKPGVYQGRDDQRKAGQPYTYRLLVRDTAERQNRTFNELTF